MKLLFTLFISFFFAGNIAGQAIFFEQEKPFILHLHKNKLYDETLRQLDKLKNSTVSATLIDTLKWTKSLVFIQCHAFDSSLATINGIQTPVFKRFDMCKTLSLLNTRQYKTIAENKPTESLLYYSALALHQKKLTPGEAQTAPEPIESHIMQLNTLKHKSVLIAMCMSAVIPGSGKVYAGRKWQGLIAFISCGLLAAQSIESYYKAGPQSPRFVISAALFTAFYGGNIIGSAFDARNYYPEHYKTIENEIIDINNRHYVPACDVESDLH